MDALRRLLCCLGLVGTAGGAMACDCVTPAEFCNAWVQMTDDGTAIQIFSDKTVTPACLRVDYMVDGAIRRLDFDGAMTLDPLRPGATPTLSMVSCRLCAAAPASAQAGEWKVTMDGLNVPFTVGADGRFRTDFKRNDAEMSWTTVVEGSVTETGVELTVTATEFSKPGITGFSNPCTGTPTADGGYEGSCTYPGGTTPFTMVRM